jgi:hypothetical protein
MQEPCVAFEERPADWAPYLQAKQRVESYPQGQQEPGCEIALIRHDPEAALIEFHLKNIKLPSACPRFASRACPRMAPMGHEPAQETCNYWDYPRMAELSPGLELYPEWQRFDCHKYYALFQAHLVGEELALSLGALPKFVLHGSRPEDEKFLKAYAGLTSRPEAFIWSPP